MTPRALAADTIALLKPLSCHAMAAASEGETPCSAATRCTSDALSRAGVGSGAAGATTTDGGAGSDARAGRGAPAGSLMTVPASSSFAGSSPFMAAIASSDTPAPTARPDSVSPQRTVYAPCGAGAAVEVATVGEAVAVDALDGAGATPVCCSAA